MGTKTYHRLSLRERVIVQTLLEEKRSKSFIARKLSRSRSTVSREVNKWTGSPKERYDATLADWNARDDQLNKRNLDRIGTHKRLRAYVYRGLLKGWSPEQISGRIKIDHPEDPVMSISYEAIYCHIYSHPQARPNRKLIELLPYRKTRRRRANAKTKRGSRIKDRVSIEQRPPHIEDREEPGHWEGDLVIGKGQKSAIGTLVERTARYVRIAKLKDRKSDTVVKGSVKEFKTLDRRLTKTLTYDNGLEMARHRELTRRTGMPVYFAHPYASWERGTNENTNGLIRRYLPKGTDFSAVPEKRLKEIERSLNDRPRKVLGYRTPTEAMALPPP